MTIDAFWLGSGPGDPWFAIAGSQRANDLPHRLKPPAKRNLQGEVSAKGMAFFNGIKPCPKRAVNNRQRETPVLPIFRQSSHAQKHLIQTNSGKPFLLPLFAKFGFLKTPTISGSYFICALP